MDCNNIQLTQRQYRESQVSDLPSIKKLIFADDVFKPCEKTVAFEVIEQSIIAKGKDYFSLLCILGNNHIAGFASFGPTPMTKASWDLYWILTDKQYRGQGIANALLQQTEKFIANKMGELVRIEVASNAVSAAARHLYSSNNYTQVGHINNFYDEGDHLMMLVKYLLPPTS